MNRTTGNETKDPYRLKLHLTPPTGWLNDPNGLCQYHGTYHAFYQYVPENALGNGRKCWGHAVSSDLIHWKDEGIFLEPDRPFDRDGVYSGCAWTDENGIHLFYTGNVKEEGDYDYIHEGRQAAQVLVETKDGSRAGEKRLLLTNDDYPKDCTLHVRDPKVWKENGGYYMVLGARKDSDQGAVLLYESADMVTWEYVGEMTTKIHLAICGNVRTVLRWRTPHFCPSVRRGCPGANFKIRMSTSPAMSALRRESPDLR